LLVLNLLSPSPDLGSLDCRILTLSSQGPFGYVRYVMGYGSWPLVCSSSKAAIRRQPTEFSLSSSVKSLHLTTFPFPPSLSSLYHISSSTRGRLNRDEAGPTTDSHLDSFSTRISTTLRLLAGSIHGMCCIGFAPTPKEAMTVSEDEGQLSEKSVVSELRRSWFEGSKGITRAIGRER